MEKDLIYLLVIILVFVYHFGNKYSMSKEHSHEIYSLKTSISVYTNAINKHSAEKNDLLDKIDYWREKSRKSRLEKYDMESKYKELLDNINHTITELETQSRGVLPRTMTSEDIAELLRIIKDGK